MFSYCDKCGGDNLTDLPVCAACASTVHFTHRPCHCADCVAAHDQAEQADTPMLKLVQQLREADSEFAGESITREDFKSDRVSDFCERMAA